MARHRKDPRPRRSPPNLTWLLIGMTVGLFVVGSLNLRIILDNSPIFSPEERVEDPFGEWRRVTGNSLYRLPDYRRDSGVGYLGLASDLYDEEYAERARDLFQASLRLAPGDAITWSLLAWSEAFLGNEATAFEAQRRSWSLAPFNTSIARERLAFVAAFADRYQDQEIPDSVRQDVALLTRNPLHRRFLDRTAADVPLIAQIWQEQEAAASP